MIVMRSSSDTPKDEWRKITLDRARAMSPAMERHGVKIGFELRVDKLRMARSNQPCSSSTCCGVSASIASLIYWIVFKPMEYTE